MSEFPMIEQQIEEIIKSDRAMRQTLGELLFGENVANFHGTRHTIDRLREALDYLEARYARQYADHKRTREAAAVRAANKKPASEDAKPGARRGRKPKANGTVSAPAGAPLPFGPGPAAEA